VSRVDPERLIDALQEAGFGWAGQRVGVYVRLSWPEHTGRDGSLIIPLDPAMADYDQLLTAAVADVTDVVRLGQAVWVALFNRNLLDLLNTPAPGVAS
jgi:hypothetical protein